MIGNKKGVGRRKKKAIKQTESMRTQQDRAVLLDLHWLINEGVMNALNVVDGTFYNNASEHIPFCQTACLDTIMCQDIPGKTHHTTAYSR